MKAHALSALADYAGTFIPGESIAARLGKGAAAAYSAGAAVFGPGKDSQSMTRDVVVSGTGLGFMALDETKAFEEGSPVAKSLKPLGILTSAVGLGFDFYDMYHDYNSCMTGR